MICPQVRARLDLFLDLQLPEQVVGEIEEHLAGCEPCREVLANREALRVRVRSAVRSEELPMELEYRVRAGIVKAGPPRKLFAFPKLLPALAAAVLIGAGAYYFWPDEDAAAPGYTQAEFIARAASGVTPLMRVGLRQHLHCGVFREYPAVAPALADLAREKAVSAALIDAVETHAPAGLHVVMAHLCSYEGRDYTHIVARGDGRLMSLLIVKRGQGEDFADGLKAVAARLDLPVFAESAEAGQDRYAIDAFETAGYLVFLVSDSTPAGNLHSLEGMAAQVRAALL